MLELITITEPASEPVTTAEAKDHCRIVISDDDAYVDALVAVARKIIEQRSGMRLIAQTVELRSDTWDELTDAPRSRGVYIIPLNVAPVSAVDSVKYYDPDDADTTWSSSNYWTDLSSVPSRIQLKNVSNLPSINERIGNIRIRLTAGYANAAAVPEHFKTAIKLLVHHWYDNRSAVDEVKLTEIPEGLNNIIFGVSEFHHYSTGSLGIT